MIFTLSTELVFLSWYDLKWTERMFLPFFTSNDMEEFRVAWRGQRFVRGFVGALRKELSNNFSDIIEKINEVDKKEREMIIKYYVFMIMYGYVKDPIQDVIPRLLCAINEEERKVFAQTVAYYLKVIPNDIKNTLWQKWLKNYWINRVRNIPIPLSADETEEMINWIFTLDEFYSEIVDIVTKMSIKKMPFRFYDSLEKKIEQEKNLNDTEKLVTFILQFKEELEGFEENKLRTYAQKIIQTEGEHRGMQEALLERGIDIR